MLRAFSAEIRKRMPPSFWMMACGAPAFRSARHSLGLERPAVYTAIGIAPSTVTGISAPSWVHGTTKESAPP